MKQVGVRLHHPSLKNCVFTITDPATPYPVPFQCPMCGTEHAFKTFHLNLNENGDVTVHEQIYDLFKRHGIVHDLDAQKEVTPRPTVLDMANRFQPPIVISREDGPVKLPGMNGHGRV